MAYFSLIVVTFVSCGFRTFLLGERYFSRAIHFQALSDNGFSYLLFSGWDHSIIVKGLSNKIFIICPFNIIKIINKNNNICYLVYLKTPLSGLLRTPSKKCFCFCLFRFWLKDCFLNLISWTFRYKSRCAQNLFVSSRIFHS